MGETTDLAASPRAFPTTRWTLLLGLRGAGPDRTREQLENLFSTYWPAVHAVVARHWVRDAEEARDLTQEFFLDLLKRDFARDLSRDKGRFRHFIKAALKNFLLNRKRDAGRLKRGGAAERVGLDVEPAAPESDFDAEWRRCLLAAAMERLRERSASTGRSVYFDAFQLRHGETPVPVSEIATRLSITPFDVGNHVKWARAELRRIVLQMIGQYAGPGEESHRELSDLFP